MTRIALSKPYMDVGLFTGQGAAMRRFYAETLGLPTIDDFEVEPGYRLHRYDAHGSALKINVLEEPLARARTGLAGVVLPMPERSEPKELTDPDGLPVLLVPPGHLDVTQLGIVWRVAALDGAERFATDALGAERLGEGRYRVGETTLLFEADPALERAGPLEAIGFTYTTLHVKDVIGTHSHLVAAGCEEAIPPTPFGEVTTYSFVRDPFGNWIEVSQRADLAGAVAEVEGPVLDQAEIRRIRRAP